MKANFFSISGKSFFYTILCFIFLFNFCIATAAESYSGIGYAWPISEAEEIDGEILDLGDNSPPVSTLIIGAIFLLIAIVFIHLKRLNLQ